MIRAEALSRKYGDVTAVSDVSFEIGVKEIVGLLGHNGAGKTTIMKMLTGYLEPSAGLVTIDGVDVWSNRSRVQRQVGYLPENCPLYPEMVVLEYLDYLAVLRGVPKSQKAERLCYVLEKANLVGVAKKLIGTLSRGYRQRLGVAQALLNSPGILILDEPTNGLDPSQILEMRSLIRELAQTATLVLSTHILQEVQAVCSRVIIVNNGKVALDAGMSDLQGTGRVRIVTDKEPSACSRYFAQVEGLHIVESINKGSQYEYVVDCPAPETAALVNRTLVENGCNVYAIHPIVKDLENIFGDITTGRPPGAAAPVEANAARTEDLPLSAETESSAETKSSGETVSMLEKKRAGATAREDGVANE